MNKILWQYVIIWRKQDKPRSAVKSYRKKLALEGSLAFTKKKIEIASGEKNKTRSNLLIGRNPSILLWLSNSSLTLFHGRNIWIWNIYVGCFNLLQRAQSVVFKFFGGCQVLGETLWKTIIIICIPKYNWNNIYVFLILPLSLRRECEM